MPQLDTPLCRRGFLEGALLAGLGAASTGRAAEDRPALVAITLDLEMSAEYPRRGMVEWNYEKGNLDEPTKRYALEAARVAREFGGLVHFFCVGRVLEQPSIDWLAEIIAAGHPVGNHTYDHVNVLATEPQQTQYRFQRSPWLVRGRTAAEIIRENIVLTSLALKERLGISPDGFRTPGGFAQGLAGREDVQQMLLDLGFTWVSSLYPPHPTGTPRTEPTPEVYAGIVQAQAQAQPFAYPSGLIEVPMSPISDVTAFRTNYWKLAWFLEAVGRAVDWAIENRAVFDFLAHPSCLVVEDPDFAAIKLICEKVRAAGDKARIASLAELAARSG